MGPLSEARRCVAMPRWSARWIRRDAHAGAAARDGIALSTAERRKRARYPELAVSGHSASWCWQWRSAGGGTVMRSPCSGVSLACVRGGRRRRCASRHARAGPAAGGACSALLRSGRCAAPFWGGWCHPCPRGRRGRCSATFCRCRRSLPL